MNRQQTHKPTAEPPQPIEKAIQQKVDYAVHTAVQATMHNSGQGACLYYAMVGAVLLAEVTQSPDRFVPNIGQIATPPDLSDPTGFWELPYLPDRPNAYHAWIVDGTMKHYIDFTVRHWPTMYSTMAFDGPLPDPPLLPWNRPDLGEYLWVPVAELRELRLGIQADEGATKELLNEGDARYREFFKDCSTILQSARFYFESDSSWQVAEHMAGGTILTKTR